MFRHRIIDCRQHICNRIAEAVGLYSCQDILALDSKLLIHWNSNDTSVGFNLPTHALKDHFRIKNLSPVLDMKNDEVVKCISKHSHDGEEHIIFQIEKESLVKSVLKQSLSSVSEPSTLKPKNSVLVEYSSPNIAKPFHMGHLRSTIIGNFIANISALSCNVKRLNYLGDWGTQIGYVKLGLDYLDVPDVVLLENPMEQLSKAYSLAYNKDGMLAEAKEIFSQLEKNCSNWTDQWEKIRAITVEHLKKTYSDFGIVFDDYSYESNYRAANILHIIDVMKNSGLICMDNDCLAMEMDGSKIPLFKSDGTTLYLIRDIAAALDRIKTNNYDSLIYVVDKSQSEHLNRLKFAISKLTEKNIIHVPFGRITGMSTRKGTSVFLSDILEEAINKMAEQQSNSPNTKTSDEEVTKILAVSSLIVYILRQKRNRDFNFSWENALQATGDTGNKLQYTHCRLCSLEERCGVHLPKEVLPVTLTEPVVLELIVQLARFNEVVTMCQEQLESSFLVNYSFKVCNAVSRCLKLLKVKGQPLELAEQRLLLFHTAKNVLCSSMKMLGLQPLNKM